MTENEMNNQAAQTMPEPIAAMIEQVSSVESLIDDASRQYHDSTRWAEEPSVYDDRSSPTLQEAIDAGFNKLRDMLRDYAAALSQTAGVAEGYAVVPIEPTGDMLDAILAPWLIGTKTQRECLTEGYRAMIVAAQSNDYASRCDTRDTYGAQPGSPEFDGADAFERYLRQTTQAAPAASGVHPDALPDGTLSNSTVKRVTALAAAPVSERARHGVVRATVRATDEDDVLHIECRFDDGQKYAAIETSGHRCEEIAGFIVSALEQALTQQQATPPQPIADAVREYVTELRAQADQKMGVAGACAHDGDRARYKSAAQLLRRVADELESLLSAASDHQQNAAQGGGEK